MVNIDHTCDACGSEFSIRYEPEDTETDPSQCPFCGEYMHIPDDAYEDDEDDDALSYFARLAED